MKKRISFLICLALIMLVALSMAACHKTNVPDTPSPDDNNKTYPTVIFNFNDGTGKTQSVKMTASAKAPNVTREGYRFWAGANPQAARPSSKTFGTLQTARRFSLYGKLSFSA